MMFGGNLWVPFLVICNYGCWRPWISLSVVSQIIFNVFCLIQENKNQRHKAMIECYSQMIIQSFYNSNLIPSIDELVVWRIVDISFVFYYIWRFNLYGLIILDFNISFDWWDNFLEIEFFSEMVGFIMGLGIVFPLSSAFVFL